MSERCRVQELIVAVYDAVPQQNHEHTKLRIIKEIRHHWPRCTVDLEKTISSIKTLADALTVQFEISEDVDVIELD